MSNTTPDEYAAALGKALLDEWKKLTPDMRDRLLNRSSRHRPDSDPSFRHRIEEFADAWVSTAP